MDGVHAEHCVHLHLLPGRGLLSAQRSGSPPFKHASFLERRLLVSTCDMDTRKPQVVVVGNLGSEIVPGCQTSGPAGYVAHSKLLYIHDAVRALRHWLRARPLCTRLVEVSRAPCPCGCRSPWALEVSGKAGHQPWKAQPPAHLCRDSLLRVRRGQKLPPPQRHAHRLRERKRHS